MIYCTGSGIFQVKYIVFVKTLFFFSSASCWVFLLQDVKLFYKLFWVSAEEELFLYLVFKALLQLVKCCIKSSPMQKLFLIILICKKKDLKDLQL